MDWATFLEVMLVDEHAARAKYKMASALATDPRVKEVFEQRKMFKSYPNPLTSA